MKIILEDIVKSITKNFTPNLYYINNIQLLDEIERFDLDEGKEMVKVIITVLMYDKEFNPINHLMELNIVKGKNEKLQNYFDEIIEVMVKKEEMSFLSYKDGLYISDKQSDKEIYVCFTLNFFVTQVVADAVKGKIRPLFTPDFLISGLGKIRTSLNMNRNEYVKGVSLWGDYDRKGILREKGRSNIALGEMVTVFLIEDTISRKERVKEITIPYILGVSEKSMKRYLSVWNNVIKRRLNE